MFTWKILELFPNGVRYFASITDGKNTVETEGNHTFKKGTVNLPLDQIKESNLISWLIQDTTENEINIIKFNLESQLKAIDNNKKIEFPWLVDTFTVE